MALQPCRLPHRAAQPFMSPPLLSWSGSHDRDAGATDQRRPTWGQPPKTPSAAADGLKSGRRIMRKELTNPKRQASTGTVLLWWTGHPTPRATHDGALAVFADPVAAVTAVVERSDGDSSR